MRWKITERVSACGEQCALHTSRDADRRFELLGESPKDAFGQISNCRPKIASRLFLFRLDWEVIKVIGYCAMHAPFEKLGFALSSPRLGKNSFGNISFAPPLKPRVMSSEADPTGFSAVRLQTTTSCIAIVLFQGFDTFRGKMRIRIPAMLNAGAISA